jgi:hypothetical protein
LRSVRAFAVTAFAVLASAVLVAACGGGSVSSTMSSHGTSSHATSTTVDATVAANQSVAAVNVVLDLQSVSPPLGVKLASVEQGSSISKALQGELAKLSFAGVNGAAVRGATVLTAQNCKGVGVAAPCAEVRYTLVGPVIKPTALQHAYTVAPAGKWLVSRRSACSLLQPKPGTNTLAKPAHPAC